jgi:hypothetical protein
MKPILANRLNSILHTHIARMRSSLSGVLVVAFKSLVFIYIFVSFFLILFKAVISLFRFYSCQTV